jgi:hypothetical protein
MYVEILNVERNAMKRFMGLGWICLVMAALFMGGCFGGIKAKGADGQIPMYHAWDTLSSMGGEEEGYALYTYVILDGNSNPKTDGGRRNEALLNAIVNVAANEGEAVRSPGNPAGALRQECNIFYIPLTQKELPQFSSPLALYSLPLAQELATVVVRSMQENGDLSQRLLYGTPFLVSSPVPLPGMSNRATKLLIADLSSTSPKKMRQVVAAFRQQQNANFVDDADRFRLIRLELLSGILPLQYLSVVKMYPTAIIPQDRYGNGQ